MFKNLFRKKYKVELYLRSGLVVRGVFYSFEIKTSGYEVTSVKWQSANRWNSLHIDGSQIDYIRTRRVWF